MKALKLLIKPEALSLLTAVSNFLTGQGIESYLVGGILRDLLLERDTADIDIAVKGDAPEIATRVAATLGGKYVLLDDINRVSRVILSNEKHQWELDFSTLKGNIEQDLAQRDFTIDAIAADLSQLSKQQIDVALIDPLHGRDDLERRVIRAVAGTAFSSDAARLLRAVRLAAELGFTIDSETEALIQRHSHLIAGVAGERVRDELLRLLAVPKSGHFWHYLDELGLVTAILPELVPTKGTQQPKEHFWDVFDHSIETVDTVDFLLRRGKWHYAGENVLAATTWSATLAEHFDSTVSSGSNRRLMLKLAGLLHDVAKPQTKTVEASGRIRFLGHAVEGAVIAANIMERLRFSTREIKLVETIVRHHLRPGQMSNYGLPSRRAIYRYFRDTGDTGIDILFFSMADHLATRGPHLDSGQWQEHSQMVDYVLRQRFQEESLVAPPKLIDGHDLINIFGMSPGPRIRELLEAVREAQATGEVASRETALALIDRYLRHPLALSSQGDDERNSADNGEGCPSNVGGKCA